MEQALHDGRLMAVAATNALELGVDVGSLDLTLHLGFPGSVASLWQQVGREARALGAVAGTLRAMTRACAPGLPTAAHHPRPRPSSL